MNNSISYKIVIADYKRDNGKCALKLQVIIDRNKNNIPLGVDIQPYLFNKETGKVQHHTSFSKQEAADLNLVLNSRIIKAHTIVLNARLNDHRLTVPRFIALYNGKKTSSQDDFLEFMEKETSSLDKVRTKGSINTYKRTRKLLLGFKEQIMFNELTPGLIEDFDRYLIRLNQAPNTRALHHKNFKMFLNLADKRGVDVNRAYKFFKIRRMKGNRDFLNAQEFEAIKELYLSKKLNQEHHNVLEYFLFSCYTGLRISDMQILNASAVLSGMIVFTPVKTKNLRKVVKVPLPDFALELIKYRKGKLFDTVSDQQTNRALKDIAKAAAVKKNLTFHVARHTFATTFLRVGGTVEVLQKLLGHSKLETTMEYVHIMDDVLIDQMKNFNTI